MLTGHFEVFTGDELRVECLLASAAIPELFRAVTVPGRGVYWDGLYSQNPPIHDLTDYNINELWLIQINPSTCARVPTETHEILDRRNELAGNLSMEQELTLIEIINRLIAQGKLIDPKYHPIHVARITLDRELDYCLEARSQAGVPGGAAGVRQVQGALVPEGAAGKEIHPASPGRARVGRGRGRRRAVNVAQVKAGIPWAFSPTSEVREPLELEQACRFRRRGSRSRCSVPANC